MKFLREIFFFGFAGAVGFVVDTAVLYLLKSFVGPYYARIFSFLAAAFVTWLVNRALTFRERNSGLSAKRELATYILLMIAGGLVNYGVYAWLMASYPLVWQHPVIGVAAGSLAGMVVNLSSARFLLYQFGSECRS